MSKFNRRKLKSKKRKTQESEQVAASNTLQLGEGSLNLKSLSINDLRKPNLEFQPLSPKYNKFSLHEQNIIVLEAAKNIFNLSKRNWNNIKSKISGEQIKEFYQIIAELWHPAMDYFNLLPKPDSKLKAIYLGEIDYELISKNIFRFGLYADIIYVINPFHNPHLLTDEFNPLLHPEKFKADTLKILGSGVAKVVKVDNAPTILTAFVPDFHFYD